MNHEANGYQTSSGDMPSPELTAGKWISINIIDRDAAAGFFHIRTHIDDSVKIAPFPFRTKDNRIVYPVGDFEIFVTLHELKVVEGDPSDTKYWIRSSLFLTGTVYIRSRTSSKISITSDQS